MNAPAACDRGALYRDLLQAAIKFEFCPDFVTAGLVVPGLGLAESAVTAAVSRANSVGVGEGGEDEGVNEQNGGGEDQQGAFHGVFSPCVGGDNGGIMARDVHLRSERVRDSGCSQFVTRARRNDP